MNLRKQVIVAAGIGGGGDRIGGEWGYQVVIGLRRMPHGTGKGLSAMEIKKRIAKRKGAAV